MSIYATLWQLKFPRDGDDYLGCEWMTVIAQGVPPHIGAPTPGCGYEDGDPYAAFLPLPVPTNADGESAYMRAVVFVTEHTPKGTTRHPQEYVSPLLLLTGEAYAHMTFDTLYTQICDALRGISHGWWRRTLSQTGACPTLPMTPILTLGRERYGASWQATITYIRAFIERSLEDSPSLKAELFRLAVEVYPWARQRAAKETRLPLATLPEEPPWSLEQLHYDEFLP